MNRSKNGRSISGRLGIKRQYNQRCAVRTGAISLVKVQPSKAIQLMLVLIEIRDDVDIASQLHEWQQSGDERLWKLIISPEFAERIDLKHLPAN